jgi:hypothetical protein
MKELILNLPHAHSLPQIRARVAAQNRRDWLSRLTDDEMIEWLEEYQRECGRRGINTDPLHAMYGRLEARRDG